MRIRTPRFFLIEPSVQLLDIGVCGKEATVLDGTIAGWREDCAAKRIRSRPGNSVIAKPIEEFPRLAGP